MLICGNCNEEFDTEKTGVTLCFTDGENNIYRRRSADLRKCPSCGTRAFSDMGDPERVKPSEAEEMRERAEGNSNIFILE